MKGMFRQVSRLRGAAVALLCGAALLGHAGLASAHPLPLPFAREDVDVRAGIPGDAELEARGAVIGEIYFSIADIFDEADPRENRALYRLANRLHIKTRESAIRAQLLFRSGDPYSARVLAETERNLRRLEYLHDAFIRPIAYDGERADILVQTRDVWTLQPGVTYERKGGASEEGFEIEEENLLGRGKSITLSWSSDVERESRLLQWKDPNVLQSRWQSELTYSINDDGRQRFVDLERPFFALDARWSAGGSAFDFTRVHPRYDAGEIVDEFRREESFAEIRGGVSTGLVDGWARRWLAGFRYHDNRFALEPGRDPPAVLPADRKLVYPWVGLALIEDDYLTTANLNQLGRVEDLYYGTQLTLQLGWAGEALGSDRDAALFAASLHAARQFRAAHSWFLDGGLSGRLESGRIANGLVHGTARYYWRWHPKRVLYAGLEGVASEALDPENQVQIGGDTGLRGYPLRFQTGSSRALLTLEQRFYTDWFPWRLFYVGGAVFFDAGRTWGRGVVGEESSGWLKDVGIGLRLGNARSGFGSVLHFDIAVPLDRPHDIDSVQFLVETKKSF